VWSYQEVARRPWRTTLFETEGVATAAAAPAGLQGNSGDEPCAQGTQTGEEKAAGTHVESGRENLSSALAEVVTAPPII
jgi:hypothetical protein